MADESTTSEAPNPEGTISDDDSLFKSLSEGFSYLRKRRDFGEEEAGDPPFIDKENSCALVNFIDPTSAPGSLIPTTPGAKPPLELYEKLLSTFEKDYGLKLKQLSYQHFRSGASGTIDTLPVRPVLTKSHGGLVSISGDTGTAAWGDTADGDPTSWHCTPYCHVYIAACESLEHYRNKVKPSVQALVSQIEAVTGSPLKSDGVSEAVSGNAGGAHYVIVYVPTGEKAPTDDQHHAKSRVGAAFASRVAAARQRMSVNRDMPSDSGHSGATSAESSEADQEGSEYGTEKQMSVTSHLTKVEREIARRFAADFPNGNVCTMSTLNEPSETTRSEKESDDKLLQKLEWASFTKALGNAITDGFRDKCRRYDEELRRLDAQRASDGKSNGDAESTAQTFNLSYFFLVKESLALTYEQMHLPSEALLQYNELRAFIPENRSDILMNGQADDASQEEFSHGCDREKSSLAERALAGDIDGFRSELGAMAGLTPESDVFEQYLFHRETSLLFKIGDPVEIVMKCFGFARTMFAIKQLKIDMSKEAERRKLAVEAEKWAFDFCWDVKKASNRYLVVDLTESPMKADAERRRNTTIGAFARLLCDLLEFARLRLLRLGHLLLPEGSPVNHVSQAEATVLRAAWSPWEPPTSEKEPPFSPDAKIKLDPKAHILDGAFSSQPSFQYRYLEVLNTCVALNRFSGRQRTAVRLQIEAVEIHIRKGDKDKAIKALRSISEVYGKDTWTVCHFFMLFRLAGIQRQIGSPSEYLKTLIYAFNEKTAARSPSEALKGLQKDLEAVVEKSIPDNRFNAVPLFDPTLGLEGRKTHSGAGLVKKLFAVGENVSVSLSLKSYLPGDITVDSVTVELIPFRVYVAAMEDSIPIKKDDVHKVLSLPQPTSICSGDNSYTFEWVPMSPGQFIVAAIAVQWNEVGFDYFMPELRRPTIRIDVVPSESTQSLKVQPAFLVPGHQQPLSVIFSSGSDIVNTAVLQLVCSPGLQLLPPGEAHGSDRWAPSCDVEIPPCPAGESVVLRALVKGTEIGVTEGSAQSVHVKIASSYRYAKADAAEADTDGSCMDTMMEAVVATLGNAPLSVEGVHLVPYSVNKRMLNISLLCHTLAAFTIKSWRLDLPSYLSLADGGDLNESLANLTVISGDRLSFGFDCAFQSKRDISVSRTATFLVDLEDEHGTSFHEKLGLEFESGSVSTTEIPDVRSVCIEICQSAETGFVGVPIKLAYSINTSALLPIQEKVSYRIDTHDSNWTVSGKAEGIVDCLGDSPLRLDFVAIPARPGCIDSYPALDLALGAEIDSAVALPATLLDKKSFYALFPSSHTAIAVPMPEVKLQRASL